MSAASVAAPTAAPAAPAALLAKLATLAAAALDDNIDSVGHLIAFLEEHGGEHASVATGACGALRTAILQDHDTSVEWAVHEGGVPAALAALRAHADDAHVVAVATAALAAMAEGWEHTPAVLHAAGAVPTLAAALRKHGLAVPAVAQHACAVLAVMMESRYAHCTDVVKAGGAPAIAAAVVAYAVPQAAEGHAEAGAAACDALGGLAHAKRTPADEAAAVDALVSVLAGGGVDSAAVAKAACGALKAYARATTACAGALPAVVKALERHGAKAPGVATEAQFALTAIAHSIAIAGGSAKDHGAAVLAATPGVAAALVGVVRAGAAAAAEAGGSDADSVVSGDGDGDEEGGGRSRRMASHLTAYTACEKLGWLAATSPAFAAAVRDAGGIAAMEAFGSRAAGSYAAGNALRAVRSALAAGAGAASAPASA